MRAAYLDAGEREMKRLIGAGLASLVHVLLLVGLMRSPEPLPSGEVVITDLTNEPVFVASR